MNGRFKASWRVVLALALMLSLSLVTAAPAVANVSAVSVGTYNATVGATTGYTIVFTTTKNLTQGEDIIIDFPTGTNITAASGVTVDGSAANATIPVSGPRLYITVNATCLAGSRVVFIDTVVNPTTAGSKTLSVSTSQEPTPVVSAAYTLYPDAVANIVISPKFPTVTANTTQTYTAVSRDAYNNTVQDISTSANMTWNITAGAVATIKVNNITATNASANNWTVTANYTNLGIVWNDTASLNVTPGALKYLKIITGADATNTTAGNNISQSTGVAVNATDAWYNLIPKLSITAAIVAGTGTAGATLSGTPTVATNSDGVANFTNLWIDKAGLSYKLGFTATFLGGSTAVNSSVFNISAAGVSKLTLTPATKTITANNSTTYTYSANDTDKYGNNIGANSSWVDFIVLGEPPAGTLVFTNNIVSNCTKAGTWTISANESATITGTATLVVNPATAQSITIAPKAATVTSGDKVTYTATAKDVYNNNFAVTAAFSINGTAGGSWSSNVYTAEHPGTWTVVGTYGALTPDTATLYVQPAMCFIATAAYGTPMAQEIQILRAFRDGYLLTNPLGRALVAFYYRTSPPIAQFITEHPSLKPIVRAMLVPALAMSTIVVNNGVTLPLIVLGLVLLAVALAVWATRRRGRGPAYV
jgi:hypothetical protein